MFPTFLIRLFETLKYMSIIKKPGNLKNFRALFFKSNEEMDKKFNYVYITTNLVNGKQYVGNHSTNKLDDGYLGSGRPYFQNAMNEYGKENFKKEIIEFFETKQLAHDAQEKYIQYYNTLRPNGYNLSPKGGIGCMGCFSKETMNYFSKIAKGKNNPMYGKTVYDTWVKKYGKEIADEKEKQKNERLSKSLSGENNPFYNKTHSEEQKKKWSKERNGKKLTERHIQHIRDTHPDYKGENHPNFGKKLNDNKIRIICEYCNKLYTLGNYKRYHGNNCKHKK